MSWKLPGIKVQPIIGNFDLITIDNLLLEDTISVSQTITPSWHVQRSHGIKKASGKTAQATVSESSIVLLGNDVFNSEAKISKTLCSLCQ